MQTVLLFSLLLLFFSCSEQSEISNDKRPSPQGKTMSEASKEWSYKAVEIDDNSWGYQIYEGASMKIYQKNIPAVSGLHYFETKEKAEMAAEFALEKVNNGFFPPTVKPEELDSIGAINLDSLQITNEKALKALGN